VHNKKILRSLPVLLLALFASPFIAPQAHAATGVVCVAKAGATACPSLPQTFGGAMGSTVNVAIIAQGSDPYNTFDVQVQADVSTISGSSVTVGPSFGVTAQECINGTPVVGTCSPNDGPGTVHVVAGSFSPVSTTATLFTITYNIVGTTQAAGITIGYLAGCSNTSVPNTCVTLVSPSTGNPVPETVQTGTFDNAKSDFSLTADPTSVTVMQGFSGSSMITADSLGDFAGSVSLTATISPSSGAPSLSLNPTSVTLTIGSSASSTLTIASTTSTGLGSYTATVTGSGTNSTGQTVTHKATVAITISPLAVPVFIKGDVHWTHHVKLSSGGVETWNGLVNNKAGITEYVQVVVSGCADTGSPCFTAMSTVTPMSPGQTLTIPASFTFTVPGKYHFTAYVTFNSDGSTNPDGSLANPTTSPVTQSGSLAVA